MLKRFSKNLSLVLAGVLVAVGILSIFFLYTQLSRIGETEVLHSLSKAAEQTAININARMDTVHEAMQALLNDTRFQESVHRSPETETLESQLDEIRPLREAVAATADNRYISQVRVFLNDQKMLTREGVNFFSLNDALETQEYQEMMALKTSHHWMGIHQVKTVYFNQECLTLGRLYRPTFSSESRNWALLLFDVSPSVFSGVLQGLETPDEQSVIAVTDTSGKVMFGNGDETILTELMTAAKSNAWGIIRAAENELAYVIQPLEAENWSLVLYMPRTSLLSSQQTVRTLLLILIFGLTLLIIALLVILAMTAYSRSINAYIRTLHNNLKNTDHSSDPRLRAHSLLFNLDRNIAELLETNKQLTEEKMNAQLREREVTLQALQAQINPHFLYNTLDSINWMAIRVRANDVSAAITTLADYFRLSLSKGRSVVTLAEDAEIVRKYLMLYEHRYDNDYQVIWELEPVTLSCALPKLTLQPLVENALQHGIFKRREKTGGTICIRSTLENEQLVLTVADNGPGLTEPFDWSKGYGLGNVRKRLDLYFNNRYEVLLSNSEEGGAVVTVKVSADIIRQPS